MKWKARKRGTSADLKRKEGLMFLIKNWLSFSNNEECNNDSDPEGSEYDDDCVIKLMR